MIPFDRKFYTLHYSRCLRIGSYTIEVFDKKSFEKATFKRDNFDWHSLKEGEEDFDRVKGKQPTKGDYDGHGWHMGHLASFANYASTENGAKSTMLILNCAPQAPTLNRGPFRTAENKVRERLQKTKEYLKATVYTGTAFQPKKAGPNSSFISFGMIGNVAVPSHWYKLVLYHLKDPVKPYDIEAWIFPNENVYEKGEKLHDFHKTLEDIYELSNERFPVQKDDARSFNWDKDS